MYRSTRVSCVRLTMDRSRRTPPPDALTVSRFARNSGRLSMNHCMRRVKPGSRSITSGSSVSTAKSGISPTIERTLS